MQIDNAQLAAFAAVLREGSFIKRREHSMSRHRRSISESSCLRIALAKS